MHCSQIELMMYMHKWKADAECSGWWTNVFGCTNRMWGHLLKPSHKLVRGILSENLGTSESRWKQCNLFVLSFCLHASPSPHITSQVLQYLSTGMESSLLPWSGHSWFSCDRPSMVLHTRVLSYAFFWTQQRWWFCVVLHLMSEDVLLMLWKLQWEGPW